MTPPLSSFQSGYMTLGNAVVLRNEPLYPWVSDDLCHVFGAQCCPSIPSSKRGSALFLHILLVLGARSEEQVSGVEAPPVVAPVADGKVRVYVAAVRELVRKAMDLLRDACGASVPVAPLRDIAGPVPAPGLGVNLLERLKVLLYRRASGAPAEFVGIAPPLPAGVVLAAVAVAVVLFRADCASTH